MAKFSSPPAGPLAAGLESDFCRCRLEVLHVFQNFTRKNHRVREISGSSLSPEQEHEALAQQHSSPMSHANRSSLRRLSVEDRAAPVSLLFSLTQLFVPPVRLPPVTPGPPFCACNCWDTRSPHPSGVSWTRRLGHCDAPAILMCASRPRERSYAASVWGGAPL